MAGSLAGIMVYRMHRFHDSLNREMFLLVSTDTRQNPLPFSVPPSKVTKLPFTHIATEHLRQIVIKCWLKWTSKRSLEDLL